MIKIKKAGDTTFSSIIFFSMHCMRNNRKEDKNYMQWFRYNEIRVLKDILFGSYNAVKNVLMGQNCSSRMCHHKKCNVLYTSNQ